MSKSKLHKEQTARFPTMPEGDLRELRDVMHRQLGVLNNDKNVCTGTIMRINKELARRQSVEADRVVVTDHAVVRYLERMEGMDLEVIRQKITDMKRRAIRRNSEFMDDPVTGMVVVVKEGSDSVATLLDKDAQLGHTLREPPKEPDLKLVKN